MHRIAHRTRRSWIVALLMVTATTGVSEPVARIGDRSISVEEYETLATQLRQTGYGHIEAWTQDSKREVLDGIIARELLVLEGRRRGVDQDSVIAADIDMTEERALMNRLYDLEALHGDYAAAEEELRAFYVERQYDVEVFSRHIVCATEAEARQVLAALAEGVRFEVLIPKYSLPNIQRRFGASGWVGWFKIGDLFDDLKEPLSTMAPGEIYPEPILTDVGYHVFGLKTRRPVDFEASREFLREQVRVQKRADDMERYVHALRARYHLEAHPAALQALGDIPAGQNEVPDDDRVLFNWTGGQVTIGDYMDSIGRRPSLHPAGLDSARLHKAADNLAGRQIMRAEATRLGLDVDPEVRRQVDERRAELITKWLFQAESKRRARAFTDDEVRDFYDQNLELFTREDGKVTEFEFLRDSIQTLLRNRARDDAMDAFLAELREAYADRIEIDPEALQTAFADEAE